MSTIADRRVATLAWQASHPRNPLAGAIVEEQLQPIMDRLQSVVGQRRLRSWLDRRTGRLVATATDDEDPQLNEPIGQVPTPPRVDCTITKRRPVGPPTEQLLETFPSAYRPGRKSGVAAAPKAEESIEARLARLEAQLTEAKAGSAP